MTARSPLHGRRGGQAAAVSSMRRFLRALASKKDRRKQIGRARTWLQRLASGPRMVYVLRPLYALTPRIPVYARTDKNTGYRTFLDPRGRLWEVWMVQPSSIE